METRKPENSNVTRPAGDTSLQKQAERKKAAQPHLFGTFSGVFTPTLLTILGVIMFLREGWVVGNAGLAGAWLIIALSFTITTCTAMSLASVTTNIRIGAGGAFSIISQSLGLEVGGSIGIPLYLAQALAVSMYIFGFRAGWLWIFPQHPAIVVDLATFGVLFAIAFTSAGLAFKIQYIIMAIIAGALISIGAAAGQGSMTYPIQWWGDFPGSVENDFAGIGFWAVFAVFFPASTGIMAGANMSGELKNPRKSIPVGTLSAIGLSLLIYLTLAYWLARSASTEELVHNYTIMVDRAAWGPAVLAGLLGATFSSALSSLVGAPRILQALGSHDILPAGKWFAAKTAKGEPRNGMLLTGVLVFGALMLRNLNAIAPLITMFFLLTYAMINVVVLLEQSLRLVSFRPLLRFPRLVAFTGMAGCFLVMFIVNPLFSVIAVAVILVIHTILIRRHLRAPFGDVRSGLYVAVAEWAAKKVEQLTVSRQRTWKANILVPVERPEQLSEIETFVRDISYPKGFLKIVGLTSTDKQADLAKTLQDRSEQFRDHGVFASWTVITAAAFGENLQAGIETFGGAFFKPNLVFLTMPQESGRQEEVAQILQICKDNSIGALLLYAHPEKAAFGEKATIQIWFTQGGPDWQLDTPDLGPQDLAVLIGYKLKVNWKATIRFVAQADKQTSDAARRYLELVAETARIPNAQVATTSELGALDEVPGADIHIIRLPEDVNFDRLREYQRRLNSTCLFTLDSGYENALA